MSTKNTSLSIGLLLLRVAFGCLMLVHGIPKLMGFNEMADKFPDPLGMGSQVALMSAIGAEVGCSILLILGLAMRLAAIPLAITMTVALFIVHGNDAWKVKELAATHLSAYIPLIFTGAGAFSLDHLIANRKRGLNTDPAVATS